MISFEISIAPVAQARARHAYVKALGRTMSYTDKKQRQAVNDLCALLIPHRPAKPLEGPLRLDVAASMPIPESWPKKKQTAAEARDLWPTGKPDLDNLIKHLKDCMTKVGFWIDDRQVVILEARKYYSANKPGWYVTVSEVEGENQ